LIFRRWDRGGGGGVDFIDLTQDRNMFLVKDIIRHTY
jgi:hypothetical protein